MILLTIAEASALSGIGTTRLHEMARDPRCPFVVYNGTKKMIKRRKLEAYLENATAI